MQPSSGSFNHVCAVVADINESVESLSNLLTPLGVGPWKVIDYSPSKEDLIAGGPFRNKSAMARLSPTTEINLIQPIQGLPTCLDFLKQKGEGLHHLAFSVQNYDEVLESFLLKGLKVISAARFKGRRWCYINTDTLPGGFVIELLEAGLHDAV